MISMTKKLKKLIWSRYVNGYFILHMKLYPCNSFVITGQIQDYRYRTYLTHWHPSIPLAWICPTGLNCISLYAIKRKLVAHSMILRSLRKNGKHAWIHWDPVQMVVILQMTFSSTLPWKAIADSKFHCNRFSWRYVRKRSDNDSATNGDKPLTELSLA